MKEKQKRESHHVNNSDQYHNTNGGSNGVQSNDSQIYYHHKSEISPQPNGPQNGGYTTSIYVGTKSESSRPSQMQSDSQYQQLQPNIYQQHPDQQYHQQSHQYYNHSSQRQQIPLHEQNGHNHSGSLSSGQFYSNSAENHGSSGEDIFLLQQRLASASINDAALVNGNGSMPFSSGMFPNQHLSSNSGVESPFPHHNFSNASYPSPVTVPSQGHFPHSNAMRGHALGSIMENGLYENDEEDAFSNHQRQHQMYNQQNHQHYQHQIGALAPHQQPPFVPLTRPQQSWGSGWTPPPSALSSETPASNGAPLSMAPPQKIYHVIPPPPPLTDSVFAGRRDVTQPSSVQESQIVSEKGTVRGFKNRVRAGIATFWAQPQDPVGFLSST